MNTNRRRGFRIGRWLPGFFLAAVAVLAVHMWWVVARFDTVTLPARHGQVDAQLFARDGERRPLLVGLGGADALTTPAFSFHDHSLPFVPMTWGATPDLLVGNLRGAFETIMRDGAAMARAAIPVEKINGPLQFVSASQDEMWPSQEMAAAMMRRLEARGFRHHAEHLVVQGGHAEPLDEFPKMEAFLDARFKQACR